MFVHRLDSPRGQPVSAVRCSHGEGWLPDSCGRIGRVWARRGTGNRQRQVFPSVPVKRSIMSCATSQLTDSTQANGDLLA
jgi:hypothetical protein